MTGDSMHAIFAKGNQRTVNKLISLRKEALADHQYRVANKAACNYCEHRETHLRGHRRSIESTPHQCFGLD